MAMTPREHAIAALIILIEGEAERKPLAEVPDEVVYFDSVAATAVADDAEFHLTLRRNTLPHLRDLLVQVDEAAAARRSELRRAGTWVPPQ